MDQSAKIVTRLPLRELWREDGFVTTSRARSLAEDDITALLRVGPVGDSNQFWKSEAKPHLAADAKAVLADFRDGYCHFASQWDGSESAPPIVVLEKSH
jgi:hypothetical protein